MSRIGLFVLIAALTVPAAFAGNIYLIAPDDPVVMPDWGGPGTAEIHIMADDFTGFAGIQATLAFLNAASQPQSGISVLLVDSVDPFGNFAVRYNSDFFGPAAGIASACNDQTAGFVLLAGTRNIPAKADNAAVNPAWVETLLAAKGLTGLTWIMSITYKNVYAPDGVYTISVDPSKTLIANGSQPPQELPYYITYGSYSYLTLGGIYLTFNSTPVTGIAVTCSIFTGGTANTNTTKVYYRDRAVTASVPATYTTAGKTYEFIHWSVAYESTTRTRAQTTLQLSTSASRISTAVYRLLGDADCNGVVNILDLILIRNRLNADAYSLDNWKADTNYDYKINILDMIFTRNCF